MQTIRITTSQNIDIDYEVAGLGERIIARLIDFGIFTILFYLASVLSSDIYSDSRVFSRFPFEMMLWLVLFAFYDIICEAFFNGQSIGKHIMKIRVISLDGGRPTLGQYLMRWLFRIVDFMLTMQAGALISVIVTEKKQRIGDIVAGTTLISTKLRTERHHVAFAPVPDNYKQVFAEAGLLSNVEVVLIHEVISNFRKSDNYPLIYSTATRLKQHLNITTPVEMDDLTFLETLILDYNYASTEVGLAD